MKKNFICCVLTLAALCFLSLNPVLSQSTKQTQNSVLSTAQNLLQEYNYTPPTQGMLGTATQTPEESWEEYYSQLNSTKSTTTTYPMTVKVMPTYYVWPNQSFILWGNVKWDGGFSGSGTYYWDFGDGTQSTPATISNVKYMSASHSYANYATYTATLHVTDNQGLTESQSVSIRVVLNERETRRKRAIEDGLRYLYLQQYADGHWYGNYSYAPAPEVAATGLALLSFEENGHQPWNSPDHDIYKEVVQKGFQYLWGEIERNTISNQTYGNPDGDGNGYGYHFSGSRSSYADPTALAAIVTSNSPNQVITNGPSWVQGQTYLQVVQNLVDEIAWSQSETGNGRGGWRYDITGANAGDADMSTTQWPVLGLLFAESWGITAPSFVRNELANFSSYAQNADGHYGYTGPGDGFYMSRQGSGAICLYYRGLGPGNSQYDNMINYYINHYTVDDGYSGKYGLYALYKGLWFYGLLNQNIGSHTWWNDYVDLLTSTQGTSGDWPGSWGSNALNTGFSILVLTPKIIVPNDILNVDITVINKDKFPKIAVTADITSYGLPLPSLTAQSFTLTENGNLQSVHVEYVDNQYILSYTTDEPNLFVGNRNVFVEVTTELYDEVQQQNVTVSNYGTSFYVLSTPPVINRTAATIALSNQINAPGVDFIIEAYIEDYYEPYLQSASIFYRPSNSGTGFVEVPMYQQSGSLWRGYIPGNASQTPGIDYYISATDGSNTSYKPTSSADVFPYQIPVENLLPVITHTPVLFGVQGLDVSITATATDNTTNLTAVNLHYRGMGQQYWEFTTMSLVSGSTYQGTIPGAYFLIEGCEYYISATDNFNLIGYSGFIDCPFQIVPNNLGNLKGTITNAQTGTPIPNVTVSLQTGGTLVQTVTSGEDGSYTFYGVQPGTYTAKAQKLGYITSTSGNLAVASSQETTYNFALNLNNTVDVALANIAKTTTLDPLDPLLLNINLINLGAQDAQNVKVAVYSEDITLAHPPMVQLGTIIIPSLEALQSHTAQSSWLPASDYVRITAEIDPDDIYSELDELNNIKSVEFAFTPPTITDVVALIDENPSPSIIGKFMSGIENNMNTFTATVTDPEGIATIKKVIFQFGNTITLEDTDGSDGWSVEVDMGIFPSNDIQLKVLAYDITNLASAKMIKTIDMYAPPPWLSKFQQTGPYYFEDGMFKNTLKLKNLQTGNSDMFNFSHTLYQGMKLIGSLQNEFDGGIEVEVGFPVDDSHAPYMKGGFKLAQEVLGREVGSADADITFVLASDYTLQNISYTFSEDVILFRDQYTSYVETGIPGLQVILGIGFEIFAGLTFEASSATNLTNYTVTFSPYIGGAIHGTVGLQILYGLARGEATVSPTLQINFDLVYNSNNGFGSDLNGEFEVRYNLMISFFWGLWKDDIISGTWGPWSLGNNKMNVVMVLDTTLAIPQVLPYPQVRTDSYGNLAVIWVTDKDTLKSEIDPELAFSYKTVTGNWSTPVDIESNDYFESCPDISFMHNDSVVAVWVRNSISKTQATGMSNITMYDILNAQDIYYAIYDTVNGWGTSAPVISDAAGSYYSDGVPSVDFNSASQGLVLWTRSSNNTNPFQAGAMDIYYSVWSGSSWSTPAILVNNANSNFEPIVRFNHAGTSALAVWKTDVDGLPQTPTDNELAYSMWNGTSWSAAQSFTSNALNEYDPVIAALSNGDFVCSWIEEEMDNTSQHRQCRVMANLYSAMGSQWGTPELVYTDSFTLEKPVLNIDTRNIAGLLWKGTNGTQTDLFFSAKDYANGSLWTTPGIMTDDAVSDWMSTATIDAFNNMHYIDFKFDLDENGSQTVAGPNIMNLMSASNNNPVTGTLDTGLTYLTYMLNPDLEITDEDIYLMPVTSIEEGDSLQLVVNYHNISAVPINGFTVDLYQNGALVLSLTDSLLGTTSDSLVWDFIVSAGLHHFEVFLDSANVVAEVDDTNNDAAFTLLVASDLMAENLNTSNPTPVQGEVIQLSANIRNLQGADANNIIARFFDGSTQIGSDIVIDSLLIGDTVSISANYTVAAGLRDLSAVVNPDSLITEVSLENNAANLQLDVRPDLAVYQSDISFNDVDSFVITTFTVYNIGGSYAANVPVQLWNGDPIAPTSLMITQLMVDTIFEQDNAVLTYNWMAPFGMTELFVVVDPANTIEEKSWQNNQFSIQYVRVEKPDLSISQIQLNPAEVQQYHPLEMAVSVSNTGNANAVSVQVRCYDGNPLLTGVEIANSSIAYINGGSSVTKTLSWDVDDATLGLHDIYVYVDPNDIIIELDETNNLSNSPITVVADTTSPVLASVPVDYYVSVESGSTLNQSLTLYNNGNSTLNYSIATELLPDSILTMNNPGNGAGKSAWFDGSGDYVTTADIDLAKFTLEAWIYLTPGFATTENCILSKWYYYNDNVREFLFALRSGNYMRLNYSSTGGNEFYLDSPTGLFEEYQWYHVAATIDSQMVRLYVNDQIVAETVWENVITSNGTGNVVIGRYNTSWDFHGQIDEVRIWDYARNQAEIASTMNSELSGNEPGLVAYWTMDNHFLDLTGNGANGTPYGNVYFKESEAPIGSANYEYTASGLPKTIGPNANAVTESSILVSDNYPVGDLNLMLDITHGSLLDMSIELISPTGTVLSLISTGSISGTELDSTILNDEALNYISTGSSPFASTYKLNSNLLSIFDNEPVEGTWTLRITDHINGDGGSLNFWKMMIRKAGPAWLQVSPLEGSIAAGANEVLNVDFISGNLTPGEYFANIMVNSNDPVTPEYIIPTSTTISGNPELMLAMDTLDFDTAFVGFSNTISLGIANVGNGLANITNVQFATLNFSANPTSFNIPVGETYYLDVLFHPDGTGFDEDVMTIVSNDQPRTAVVQGIGLQPPAMTVAPMAYSDSLSTGETSTHNMLISNSGEYRLDYHTQARVVANSSYNHIIYVANRNSNSVSAIDVLADSIIGTITVPYAPVRLTLNPDASILWMSYDNSAVVSFIQVSEFYNPLAAVQDIGVAGTQTSGVAISINNDGISHGYAYVGNPAMNTLDRINLTNAQVETFSATNVDPVDVLMAPNGIDLFVLSSSYLHVFNTYTEEFTQIATGYNTGYGLAISPDGKWLYTTDRYYVRRYNAETYQYINNINLLNYGREISLSPDGELLAVADLNNSYVRFLDNELNLLATVTNINHPTGLEISEDNMYCYVSERDDDEVNRILLNTFEIDTTWNIPVGDYPLGVALPRSIVAPWAYAEPDTNSVDSLQSFNGDMIFDASGLRNGNYEAELWISSNDPYQPKIIADLNLEVTEAPYIHVDPEALIFPDTILTGLTDTLTFMVYNEGYDTLIVTDIQNTNSVFSLDMSAFTLAPTDSHKVTVVFTPDTTAFEQDVITILNNDDTRQIPVEAHGLLAPILTLSATTIDQTLQVGGSATQTFNISNMGYSNLEFAVQMTDYSNNPNKSALFDGSGDYITIPDNDSLDVVGHEITVEAWVKCTSFSGDLRCVLGKIDWSVTTNWSYNMHITDVGALHFNFANTSGTQFPQYSTQHLSTNTWYHVAATYDGSFIRLYIDGTEVLSSAASGDFRQNTYPVRIGSWYTSDPNYFNGRIDEVRIWHTVRSQAEIQGTAQTRLIGNEPGLVGYWNFDGTNPWTDGAGFAANGTTSGNATTTLVDLELLPTWLAWSGKDAAGLLPGEMDTIIFDFNANNLIGGVYPANMRINSNDPQNQMVDVPITLTVHGQAIVSLSTDSLNFGTVYVGKSSVLEFDITNTGDDTLHVYNILGLPVYTMTPSNFYVLVGQTQTVSVQFTPQAAMNYNTVLSIVSDDPNAPSVNVFADGLMPPIIAVAPTTLSDTLSMGDQGNHTLLISNTGGSDLNFSFNSNQFGTGVDGPLTVGTGQTYYTDNVKSKVAWNNPSGQNTIWVSNVSGFGAGDEVLIITMQDNDTNLTQNLAGQFETRFVDAIDGNLLILDNDLQNTYNQSDTVKHQIIKIPQFTDVTVDGTMTCADWNGQTGGVLFFRANGTLTVNASGAISVVAKGYRGGAAVPRGFGVAYQGESILGQGTNTSGANLSGGGPGSPGYGGGYGISGEGSSGGVCYGTNTLERLYLGSGGGSGNAGTNDNCGSGGGFGGDGGGILVVKAANVVVDGIITASGGDGTNPPYTSCTCDDDNGGGGGGSGGSLMLSANSLVNNNLVRFSGGIGKEAYSENGAYGCGYQGTKYDGGLGRAVICSPVYYNNGTVDSTALEGILASQLPYFINFSPAQATVPLGSSQLVDVTIDASYLDAGLYNSDIEIMSNDIINPIYTIPLSLLVDSAIALVVDPSLNFDDTYVGSTSSLPFILKNTGTDTLEITDINSSEVAIFQVSDTALVIPQNGEDTVWVTFSPDTVLFYTETMSILSNDPTDPQKDVMLTGQGITDPDIYYSYMSSGSFTKPQNDSATFQLIVKNTGGSDMTYSLSSVDKLSSKPGMAAKFDGNGDYVEILDNPSLDLEGNSMSVEAWVNVYSLTSTSQCVIGKIDWSTTTDWSYNMHITSTGALHFNVANTNNETFPTYSGDIIQPNTWYHVVGTYDGAFVRLYVDGVEVGVRYAYGNIRQNSYPLHIGAWHSGGPNYFKGEIDELRIWDYALTSEEIQTRANTSLGGIDPGLAAYWNFNYDAWEDLTGNSLVGTPNGNAQVIASNAPLSIFDVVSFSSNGGILAPNQQDNLQVTFRTGNLAFGNYPADFIIESNDPVDSVVTFTNNFTVTPSDIYLAQTSVNVDVALADSISQTFNIANTGLSPLTGHIYLNIADSLANIINKDFDNGVWNDLFTDGGTGGTIGTSTSYYHSSLRSMRIYAADADRYITTSNLIVHDRLILDSWYRIITSEGGCDYRIYWQVNGGGFNLLFDTPDNTTMGWTNYYIDLSSYVSEGDVVQFRFFSNIYSTSTSNDQFDVYIDDIKIELSSVDECFAINQSTFTIPPLSNQDFTLSFNSLDLPVNTYSLGMTIISNDPDEDTLLVPVSMFVPSPEIYVNPDEFYITMYSGDTTSRGFNLGNTGYLSELHGEIVPVIPADISGIIDNFDDGVWNDFWTASGSGGSVGTTTSQYHSSPRSLRIYAADNDKYVTSDPITISHRLKISFWYRITTSEGGCDFKLYWQKNGGGYVELFNTADNTTYGWTYYENDLSSEVAEDDVVEFRMFSNIYSTGSSNDQQDTYIDDVRIALGNVLVLDERYFHIPAGVTDTNTVFVNAKDFAPGAYTFNIHFNSNDVVTPDFIMPIYLTINDAAAIWVSDDTLWFGQQFVGGQVPLTLTVYNNGSDTLEINNVQINGTFSYTGTYSGVVLPGNSLEYQVLFEPNAIQAEQGVISFTSNDPTNYVKYVVLIGEGISAPDIIVSPDPLEFSAQTQDNIIQSVTVSNLGGNNLEYEFYSRMKTDSAMWHYAYLVNHIAGTMSIVDLNAMSSSTLTGYNTNPYVIDMTRDGKYCWITNTAHSKISIYNLETGILKTITGVGTDRRGVAFSPNDSIAYVADMANNRIEVYNTNSLALIATFSTNIADPQWVDITPDGHFLYISDTGTDKVIVMNTEDYTEYATISGLVDPWGIELSPDGNWFAVRDGDYVQVGSTATNSFVGSFFVDNPRTPKWSPNSRLIYVGSNDDYKVHIFETDSFTMVKEFDLAYKPWSVEITEDEKYLVATCYDNDRLAVINLETDAINYLVVGDGPTTVTTFRTKQPIWIEDISLMQDTLIPLATDNVDITFNTTEISGGDYYAELVFETNDPASAKFNHDIIMHHNSGVPFLYAENTIDFEEVYIGYPETYQLVIKNTGTLNLSITSAVASPLEFTTPALNLVLEPDSSAIVPVICNPGLVGALNGTLTFTTNAGNTGITLLADAMDAPEVSLNPTSVLKNMVSDETSSSTVVFENSGGSNLEYSTRAGMHRDKYVIGNDAKDKILIWNSATNTLDSVSLPYSGPWRMKYSPDGNQLWITFEDAGRVIVLDAYSYSQLANIYVQGTRTSGVAFNPAGSIAYVGNWSQSRIEIIDAHSFVWDGSITGSVSYPKELVSNPDGSKLFVSNQNNDDLVVIDLMTNTVLSAIDGYSTGYDLAISPDGNYVYWVDLYYVNKFDVDSNAIVQTSANLGELRGITISEDGATVYVCAYTNDKVVGLETTGLTQVSQYTGILNPWDVALSFDESQLLVTASSLNRVAVFDVATAARQYCDLGASDFDFRDIVVPERISWLDYSLFDATLAAGGVNNLQFDFNTLDMPVGVYFAEYGIYSNDPVNPEVYLPITLNVTGLASPYISVSPGSLTIPYFGDTIEFVVSNSGTGILNWAASVNSQWMQILGDHTGGEGDTLTLACALNPGINRSGLLVFTSADAGNSPQIITINQEAYLEPIFTAGSTEICFDGQVVFSEASTGIISGYLWNFGTDAVPATATTAGPHTVGYTSTGFKTISLTVFHATGASEILTMTDYVEVNPLPVMTLGNDLEICDDETTTLYPGYYYQYLWSDNSANQSLVVSETGTYSLTVTEMNGCSSTDDVYVLVHNLPMPNLGSDIEICDGQTSLLFAGLFDSYIWSNGSTNQTILAGVQDTYSVTVTDQNGCDNNDDVFVTVHTLPIANTGADQTICEGTCATLTGTGGINYSWSNGGTGQTNVVCPVVSTQYTLTVEDGNSCTNTDQVMISVNPMPYVYLGPDTMINPGASLLLNAGAGYMLYLWNTGATTQTIMASTSGTYLVNVLDTNSCNNSDDINIIVSNDTTLPILSVSPLMANISAAGGYFNFNIANTGSGQLNWQAIAAEPWIHINNPSGTGYSYLIATIDQNLGVARVGTITIYAPLAFNSPQTIVITQIAGNYPPWTVVNTGINHSLFIPSSVVPQINNSPVAIGDFVGIFFTDSLGGIHCGGYEAYTGQNILVTAWCDDDQTSIKDGFSTGEAFSWKIWHASNGQEYNAVATYMAPPLMPNEGYFYPNGMSGLLSLESVNEQFQVINLPEGWSFFSTYIDMFEPNIDSMMQPIVQEVLIAKDGNGMVYWPLFSLNMLGDIDIGEGYQIKMNSTQTVTAVGMIVVPEITGIIVPAGWSMIGYLRTTPGPLESMLSSIQSNIIIMKDENGLVYWPIWGLNLIGTMQPGEGYQIKLDAQSTLLYPPNTIPVSKIEVQHELPVYYNQTCNTGNNMTLGIPLFVWANPPIYGDEVAVFTHSGLMVGSAKFRGGHLAIPIWGDDELTATIDGISEGADFTLRHWSNLSGQESQIVVESWIEGGNSYERNKISVVGKLQIQEDPNTYALFQNIPNPFKEETEFGFYLPVETEVELAIYNLLGKKVEVVFTGNLNKGNHRILYKPDLLRSGTYYYSLQTCEFFDTKKMVIIRK
ncbi:MAG: choice-of-anchor D domain-containing protein [Bacteroidales bacterium]|nr:choice-of-anchor D domain-containing protein [Bacteroidales bacterium]MCF8455669.1 choice-of-anchor D domain-containing protein [Bacteroidales bacterium]